MKSKSMGSGKCAKTFKTETFRYDFKVILQETCKVDCFVQDQD